MLLGVQPSPVLGRPRWGAKPSGRPVSTEAPPPYARHAHAEQQLSLGALINMLCMMLARRMATQSVGLCTDNS